VVGSLATASFEKEGGQPGRKGIRLKHQGKKKKSHRDQKQFGISWKKRKFRGKKGFLVRQSTGLFSIGTPSQERKRNSQGREKKESRITASKKTNHWNNKLYKRKENPCGKTSCFCTGERGALKTREGQLNI